MTSTLTGIPLLTRKTGNSRVCCPACCRSLLDRCHATRLLAESERKDLDAGIKKFDFECHILDGTLLTDELIHPGLSNLARAIRARIGPVIATRCGAIQA